jgi:hypothetical protein
MDRDLLSPEKQLQFYFQLRDWHVRLELVVSAPIFGYMTVLPRKHEISRLCGELSDGLHALNRLCGQLLSNGSKKSHRRAALMLREFGRTALDRSERIRQLEEECQILVDRKSVD